ncbi:TPR domain protein [Fusarium subglutinans]|uniref:TPR domain protein n=1 Tax=Gibberella subglutinans TaxID=42677 RepID=A0A8H5L078_GIBSU|nr:TPR domain protein [Fusarium subglutinans]KAF5583904.1 TPR domain protein [Fusarium subglutinans]
MAPSRPDAKKTNPDIARLLVDAQTQLEVGKVEEAATLAQQALDATGQGGDFELSAANLLGTIFVESGDIDEARAAFERAVFLDEDGTADEKIGGGPDKFLLLAQLSEEGGLDSVQWYERGATALRKQIAVLSELRSPTPEQRAALQEKQHKLGGVLCAVAEVYMTDLSWEPDAESRCETLITEAMLLAPAAPETWQTVANVRISQNRANEAQTALRRSLELWQKLPPQHPDVPEFPTRIALARLLMETELEDEALSVLERLVTDDDTSVEAWYLGGWCLYITGEKLKTTATKPWNDEARVSEEWKGSWKSSRQWLMQCLKLYQQQDYEDERLGEHAKELLSEINKELGQPADGEEDDWEDASDGAEEDAEMQG